MGAMTPILGWRGRLHHCLPFDVVESPNPVNGEQHLPGHNLRGECVLERHANTFVRATPDGNCRPSL